MSCNEELDTQRTPESYILKIQSEPQRHRGHRERQECLVLGAWFFVEIAKPQTLVFLCVLCVSVVQSSASNHYRPTTNHFPPPILFLIGSRSKFVYNVRLMKPIYLDHNATTPVLAEVARAMNDVLLAGPANPASQHQWGRRARQRIEDARETIGRLIGAQVERFDGDRLIFTCGGTESNHLALLG